MKKTIMMGLASIFFLAAQAFGAEIEVEITRHAFAPNVIEASVGDVLVFTNTSSLPHTVEPTEDSELQFEESSTLRKGDTFRLELENPGDMEILCGIHPRMRLNVVIK